jgi:hypothetical protein
MDRHGSLRDTGATGDHPPAERTRQKEETEERQARSSSRTVKLRVEIGKSFVDVHAADRGEEGRLRERADDRAHERKLLRHQGWIGTEAASAREEGLG